MVGYQYEGRTKRTDTIMAKSKTEAMKKVAKKISFTTDRYDDNSKPFNFGPLKLGYGLD